MRIRQVQTLVWCANVLVLAGAGWVGWTFFQTKRSQGTLAKVTWPESTAGIDLKPWPGDVRGFAHIWDTPVNGLVPKPPEEAKGPVVPVDPRAQFKGKVTLVSGLEFPRSTSQTTVLLTFGGSARVMRLGEFLDDGGRQWQLTSFVVRRTDGSAVAKFSTGEFEVEVEQKLAALADLLKSGGDGPFRAVFDPNGPFQDVVKRERVDRQAWFADGAWNIPWEEALWWERWGEEDVLRKLVTRTETDAAGALRGVRIASQPAAPALRGPRGIAQGDVLISVNAVPVRELKDLVAYLRGDGRGLREYTVVLERNGAQQTVLYRVEKR